MKGTNKIMLEYVEGKEKRKLCYGILRTDIIIKIYRKIRIEGKPKLIFTRANKRNI